jgi:hypothetical protein
MHALSYVCIPIYPVKFSSDAYCYGSRRKTQQIEKGISEFSKRRGQQHHQGVAERKIDFAKSKLKVGKAAITGQLPVKLLKSVAPSPPPPSHPSPHHTLRLPLSPHPSPSSYLISSRTAQK